MAHPNAGRPAPQEALVDVQALETAYHQRRPDLSDPAQRVAFGTSGHRGSSLRGSFQEEHILAIAQALCEYRREHQISGPLFLAPDTHALSRPALETALQVFAANDVRVVLPVDLCPMPTPVVSRAILSYNREVRGDLADGVVVTPSHNPPEDGGFKYNPPHGGPAESAITDAIQRRANEILDGGLRDVRTVPLSRALASGTTTYQDLAASYIRDLPAVLRLDVVASSGVRIGVDPLGGTSLFLWDRIADLHGLSLEVVQRSLDPSFAFMPLDHDGRIRMDCSSPWAMSGLIAWRDRFDVAFGCDPDADRHGIVTPRGGLMNPNAFLAVAVDHLLRHRPYWPGTLRIGKTVVTSSMLDRVARALGREVEEVPVGFKWFVPGLTAGRLGLAGEESAGAVFLCRDGTPWTTDKDGLVMGLLAAEVLALSGQDSSRRFEDLVAVHGRPWYSRVDAQASATQRQRLSRLSPTDLKATMLAGDPIQETLTRAPGNGAPIGGLKVTTDNGWFAARPSGTEDVYKIYAESFVGPDHLARLLEEARELVNSVLLGT